MPTFTNKSEQVFQDGDLIVKPGESFSTEDANRALQMRDQYAWQFSESATKKAPTEAEVKEDAPGKNVRQTAEGFHVAVDEDGKQSTKIGS